MQNCGGTTMKYKINIPHIHTHIYFAVKFVQPDLEELQCIHSQD